MTTKNGKWFVAISAVVVGILFGVIHYSYPTPPPDYAVQLCVMVAGFSGICAYLCYSR